MAGQNLANLGSRLGNATENFSKCNNNTSKKSSKQNFRKFAATYERINKGTVFVKKFNIMVYKLC